MSSTPDARGLFPFFKYINDPLPSPLRSCLFLPVMTFAPPIFHRNPPSHPFTLDLAIPIFAEQTFLFYLPLLVLIELPQPILPLVHRFPQDSPDCLSSCHFTTLFLHLWRYRIFFPVDRFADFSSMVLSVFFSPPQNPRSQLRQVMVSFLCELMKL